MSEERMVLIVDDSPTMRQLLKLAVKRAGAFAVLEASNGEEALKLLAVQPIALMLTDVNMPLMDGITLINRVREGEKFARLPIVVVTTEGEEANRARALATGACDYVTKPIQSVAVVNVVRRIMGVAITVG